MAFLGIIGVCRIFGVFRVLLAFLGPLCVYRV